MLRKFGKLFGRSTTYKMKQEFFKILELEEKRLKIVKEYGNNLPQDIAVTQRDILRNNLLTLAKVVDSEGGFENPLEKMLKQEYFNIQGTKPQVHIIDFDEYKYNDNFSRKEFSLNGKDGVTTCERIDTGIFAGIITDMLKFEEKFINLRGPKIKQPIKNKLKYLAEQKIVKKVQEFANMFKGNEQLVKEYIFSGLKGEDGYWDDFDEFKLRLNFMGLLYYKLGNPVWDGGKYNKVSSEDFEIGTKKLVYIFSGKYLELKKLLSNINIKNMDFIICENQMKYEWEGK